MSVRFDEGVTRRLTSYLSRHPGATRSSVTARYVDEGLRMDEHPGVLFRDGPSGRRAIVAGGPDVWEVVRDIRAVRRAEPDVSDADLLAMVENNTGVSRRMMQAAQNYWSAYPAEVDALLADAERAERDHAAAAEKARSLLRP